MEDILFIVGEVLSLAVIISLIIGQYRLGRRIERAEIEADFAVAYAEQLQLRIIQNEIKKPAARKAAVKKEAK